MNKQEERVVNCKRLLLNHYFLIVAYLSQYWAKVDSLNKIHAVASDQISSIVAGYITDSMYKPANMTVQTDLVSISNKIEAPRIVGILAGRIDHAKTDAIQEGWSPMGKAPSFTLARPSTLYLLLSLSSPLTAATPLLTIAVALAVISSDGGDPLSPHHRSAGPGIEPEIELVSYSSLSFMSSAQLKNLMKLILNPFQQWMLNTCPAVIEWLWVLDHDHSLINYWPSFQESYAKDIWTYADQVRQEAAYRNPRVTQTMTDMLFEELTGFVLSFPDAPCYFLSPEIIAKFLWQMNLEGIHLILLHFISMLYRERFGKKAWTLQDVYDRQAAVDARAFTLELLITKPDG
ncbi:hypothetical protein GYMLUDRAFT_241059 [Collybiopsis luxurians FD-317 M1]|nr:hypothetical protein GYMLUDRAFT_241059 [Collybiopsis luxurians FD-317 M1]